MILDSLAIKGLVSLCAVPTVPSNYMQAVLTHESRGYVYAISIDDEVGAKSLWPENEKQIEAARSFKKKALTNDRKIGVGLGQISSWNIKERKLDIDKLFEPCYNVKIASIIFEEAIVRSCGTTNTINKECLDGALRIYNTGNKKITKVGLQYANHVNKHLGYKPVAVHQPIFIQGTDLYIPSEVIIDNSDNVLLYKN